MCSVSLSYKRKQTIISNLKGYNAKDLQWLTKHKCSLKSFILLSEIITNALAGLKLTRNFNQGCCAGEGFEAFVCLRNPLFYVHYSVFAATLS